ncbi:MAG: hypothetical protein UHD09_02840 [Bifidobacterium sp.]|nr:hypothetical protein [Bifidobacterium sp.]
MLDRFAKSVWHGASRDDDADADRGRAPRVQTGTITDRDPVAGTVQRVHDIDH